MDLERKVPVINRTVGAIGYHIDSIRQDRYWPEPGFKIMLPISECVELRSEAGGRELLEEYLMIDDTEAAKYVLQVDELDPEYSYGLEEIDFLLHKGSNDQLADALDFAPIGVLSLIRQMSINNLPNTTQKVDMINNKFGIDLNLIRSYTQDNNEINTSNEKRGRRTAAITRKNITSK